MDLLRVAAEEHTTTLLEEDVHGLRLAEGHGSSLAVPACGRISHTSIFECVSARDIATCVHAQNEDEAQGVQRRREGLRGIVELRQHADQLVLPLLQSVEQLPQVGCRVG